MEFIKQQTTETIEINSKFPEKKLNAEWMSYDKNVHKVVVPVRTQSGINFQMGEIEEVLVYLNFSKGSYGPFEGKVEDLEQKTVSFAVPEEVRGQTGNVTISIMLKLTNDRQIDLVQFKAVARLSKIDQDTPAIQEFYVPLFENLVESVTTDLGADVALAKSKIDQAVTETQNVAQVEQGKIQEELPEIQIQLAQALTELNQLKSGMRWYNAYKMPDGTFTKTKPAENIFIPSVHLRSGITNVNIENTGFVQTDVTNKIGFSTEIINNTALKQLLKPNTTYSIEYMFELLTRSSSVDYINSPNGTILLYSGISGYQTILLSSGGQGSVTEAASWVVGSKAKRNAVFTTPTTLHDSAANYRVLYYTMRATTNNGATHVQNESGRFYNIKFAESSTNDIYTPSPLVDLLNAYPMRKGIGFLNSTAESDYTWQFTDEYITYLLSNKSDKTELNALANRVTALEP